MDNNTLGKHFTAADLLKFALPNTIMMVFLSLYVIVDGMFISRYVGELALSSVNMVYPILSLQYAVGVMLGTGGSAVIACKMGMGAMQEAREDFTVLVLVSAVAGLAFTLICMPLMNPLLHILGVSAAQMPYCRIYGGIMLLFSPIVLLQTVFQMYFATAGKPGLGMWTVVIGGISNVVLDALFMGPMKMGVAGAAIATTIGNAVPAVAGIFYFLFNRKGSLYYVKIRKLRWGVLLKSCTNGSSEMISNAAIAVTTFLFNLIFMHFWAENGVAAITIMSYYQFVFSSIFMGFSMGIAPVVSYKYGSGDRQQLKSIVRFCLICIICASIAVYLISRLTIGSSLKLFTDVGSPVYNIAMEGFHIYALQFLLLGLSIFASGLFTALNNGLVSGIISFARTFLFLVGSLLLLPAWFGETGVWFAVPLAETLGIVVSAVFLLWGRKKYQY